MSIHETIQAIFVKSTNEILYSRHVHDNRRSSDGLNAIDGGMIYSRLSGGMDNVVLVELKTKVLLEQILSYDYLYGNHSASEFLKGYHGRFEITENSNLEFFKRLIVNWDDIKDYI